MNAVLGLKKFACGLAQQSWAVEAEMNVVVALLSKKLLFFKGKKIKKEGKISYNNAVFGVNPFSFSSYNFILYT